MLALATFLEFDWSLPWPWAPSEPWSRFHLAGVEFTVIDVALLYFVIAGQWTALARARPDVPGASPGRDRSGGAVRVGPLDDRPAPDAIVLQGMAEPALEAERVRRSVDRERGGGVSFPDAEPVGPQGIALGGLVPDPAVVVR